MTLWRDLLSIKTFRQGQAESAMRQRRSAWQQATQAHLQAQKGLERLQREGQQQEIAQYRALCTRTVRLHDIEAVHQDVAWQRHRETLQQAQVVQKQQAQDQAAAQLEQARRQHQEAVRQKSKFVDLARHHDAAQLRELERREDLELEEAASAAREREDWGADPLEDTP